LWWRHACGLAGWCSLFAVVGLWFWGGGARELTQLGTGLNSVGRLTGLAASDLLLLQVLLIARIPLVERAFSQGEPARRHRLAVVSVILLLAHVLTITVGYAVMTAAGVWGTLVEFVVSYPGILPGVPGTVALVAVAGTSMKAARGRPRPESRHLLRLYAYLGLVLVLPHQLWTGTDFLTSTVATAFWWSLWAAAAGSVLIWRVGQPVWRSLRHRLVVLEVRPENDQVTTIVMTGRKLDRLPVLAGQFFQWRFLDLPDLTRAHPYSLSAAPDGRTLRITVAHRGEGSAALAGIRAGTRVLFEGPYGRLHEGVRTRSKVLLMASGMGIAPMRALLEDLHQRPGEVTLVYRAGSDQECILMGELNALAQARQARCLVVAGHRVSGRDSWLPQHAAHVSDAEALRLIAPDIADHDVFLCGSAGWVKAARLAAVRAGVPPEQVHVENLSC